MKRIIYVSAVIILALFQALTSVSQGNSLRIMTFNIRFDNPSDGINSWDNRKELVLKTLQEERPDIIGMQEVLQRQAIYIKNNLKGYDYAGVGRDDGRTGGEYVPVFYNYERFRLKDWGTFWLSPTPSDTGSIGWDAALTRICTWTILEEVSTGQSIFFLNTHFDHMGKEARRQSAGLILDFIRKKAGDLPVMLTGDFNCTPNEEPYQVLTDPGQGLKDACILSLNPTLCEEGTFTGFGKAEETGRIDLILLDESWKVDDFLKLRVKQGEMFVSDHWPVMAVISQK